MKTNIMAVKALFNKDIRYTIPDFQRRYVWEQEDQWGPLWEDVSNIADAYLEQLETAKGDRAVAEEKSPRHFLGAVVIQQVSTATKDIERREVIDGQQRLTTLQLLLDAVQHVSEQRKLGLVAKRLAKCVTNDEELVEEQDHLFKLWPTMSDRDAFRHAMDNGLATDAYVDSRIVQAHEYFQVQTLHWIESGPESVQDRMEALEVAITGMLQMVVIDLTYQEDPHVIFETLNARGTPLLESELVKNYVFSKSKDAVGLWGDLDSDWWRKEIKQGRLQRPRIDVLLDYWLEKHTADDVAAGRVFRAFQEHAEEEDRPIREVMREVMTDLANYRRFEEGLRNPFEEMFHYRVDVMEMGAFTPVLLVILAVPDETRYAAMSALESFLVRRMVCRFTTKDYSKLALELVKELKSRRTEGADRVVADFLSVQKLDSREWPTDAVLGRWLCELPLYTLLTRGRLRLVLEGIERQHRKASLAEESECPRGLSIEHVLPQSWEAHWPLPKGGDESEARDQRNRLVHTIGNLTLVTKRLNAAASNARWEHKRATLESHSTLFLNQMLLEESKSQGWNEDAIRDRSKHMTKLVADEWPGPDSPVWSDGRAASR